VANLKVLQIKPWLQKIVVVIVVAVADVVINSKTMQDLSTHMKVIFSSYYVKYTNL
jgi:hypothetical protein